MTEPVIDVQHLNKRFKSFQAVKDLSFQVFEGDVFGFLGPNGAGKSTTIRCMLSLIKADSGSVRMFGQPFQQHRAAILARTGCIIEKPDFYPYLSAERNLQVNARLSGHVVDRAKIRSMLEFVGLQGRENDKVRGFSQGMKQRLGIAQALVHDPDLIVLDEPTNGLDPQGIIDIRNLILQLKHEHKKTIVISSHQLSEIELIANRMVIINKGTAVVQGEVSQLLNVDEVVVTIEVDQPESALVALNQHLPHARVVGHTGQHIQISMMKQHVPQLTQVLVEAHIALFALDSKRRLEDYFISIINS